MRDDTKFIPCGSPLRYIYDENNNMIFSIWGDSPLVAIGVGDYNGKLLINFFVREYRTKNDYHIAPYHAGALIIPLDKFKFIRSAVEECEGKYYARHKYGYLLGGKSSQNIDNTNDYRESGQNAIGSSSCLSTSYLEFSSVDEYTSKTVYSSNYNENEKYTSVNYLQLAEKLNDPGIYVGNYQGVYTNSAGEEITVGYAEYRYIENEGQESEIIYRPQKGIDIVFNTEENKWFWRGYSSSTEPTHEDLTMSKDGAPDITLVFQYYGVTQQAITVFDDGGLK